MPRQQSTASKKARAAARQGAKYTTALREEQENDALYSAGARSPGFSAAFDPANSPAFQAVRTALENHPVLRATADLANSPAFQAARRAADLANSPAFQAARRAADLANNPAFQAAALAGFPDLDKLQGSMDRAAAFAVRFTPPA